MQPIEKLKNKSDNYMSYSPESKKNKKKKENKFGNLSSVGSYNFGKTSTKQDKLLESYQNEE